MIENREQLISMSTEWINMAKNDLRDKVMAFIEETGVSHQELANLLAVSNGEIEQIVNGNGDISLSTFAKLLIATNNVIEIKPISETPFGDYKNMPNPSDMEEFENIRRGMPMGRMPMGGAPMGGAPMGRMPMGGAPMGRMPMGGAPLANGNSRRNPMGSMPKENTAETANASRNNASKYNGHTQNRINRGGRRVKINLDELDKRGLANIVLSNHWNNEIDINSSSRSELIDFLEFKENMIKNMPKHETHINAKPMVHQSAKNESDNVERIKSFLYEQAMANPQLRDIVNKYMNE